MARAESPLADVDLNLLVALQALLDERNVTRAAERLGLSQPAMSRALARLRDIFDDPLFVRAAGGMAPTPRAEALAEPLRLALAVVERMVQPVEFRPADARGGFFLGATGYTACVLLPAAAAALRAEAPNVDFHFEPVSAQPFAKLESGELDIAVGVFDTPSGGFHQHALFDDDFVCLVPEALAAAPLALERYAAVDHAAISEPGAADASVEAALADVEIARRIVVRCPVLAAAGALVAKAGLVLTLPRRLAVYVAEGTRAVMVPAPLAVPALSVVALWHERRHADAAHHWLRNAIVAAARESPAPGSPGGDDSEPRSDDALVSSDSTGMSVPPESDDAPDDKAASRTDGETGEGPDAGPPPPDKVD